MASEGLPLLRPEPRRPFEISPPSDVSSSQPSPDIDDPNPDYLDPRSAVREKDGHPPSRTRSILNLTSSTLFGIYAPTYDLNREEPTTAWGTEPPGRTGSIDGRRVDLSALAGSEAPDAPSSLKHRPSMAARTSSHQLHHVQPSRASLAFQVVLRAALLFGFGVAYGVIVTHLHDEQKLAPVQVELRIERYSWRYLVFWGVAGVGLGSLLPWVDLLWEQKLGSTLDVFHDGVKTPARRERRSSSSEAEAEEPTRSGLGADWNPAVRSIGAFVGIAFAIRKLPWQSTMQVSLTLALANPVLWFLIDRSKPGFVLSTLVGLTGTAVLLGTNPSMVPNPAPSAASPRAGETFVHGGSPTGLGVLGGMLNEETIGVGTWIASVLFCSCVCFGNIGRRLALNGGSSRA